MTFSVIICTYNRSRSLLEVLNSLRSQKVPAGFQWEVLIVDNNSIDDTEAVVNKFAECSNLNLKYVKEEKQGLSHARNRGILEASGEYVAFTDDDAVVDRNWVAALYETFQKYGCDCVGGRIYLKPAKRLPQWLKSEIWGFLGFLDYDNKPFYLDKKHPPFGGNMAFTKKVFEKVGYFNPKFGRIGDNAFGGEEYDFFLRLTKAGGKACYQPAAIVHHVIGAEKLKKKYFWTLHYKAGEREAFYDDTKYGRYFFGIPLFIISQFFRSIKVSFITRFKCGKNNSLRKEMNSFYFAGMMLGYFRRYKSGRVRYD